MNETFNRIKKKRLLYAIIESAICGLAAGLIVMGVVLLALKLSEINIGAGYYVLMFILPAGITGALMFLKLRPTDKSLAKSLDREYDLHEKVQTSFEYRDREGAVLQLQREDADHALNNLPKRKPKIKTLVIYAIVCVLALSISITSIALPTKAEDATENIEIKRYELVRISNLIDTVKGLTRLDEEKRNKCVEYLNVFYDELTQLNTAAALSQSIEKAVEGVNTTIGSLFVPEKFSLVLSEADVLYSANRTLGMATANAIDSYVDISLTEYGNQLTTFINDLNDVMVRPFIEEGLNNFKSYLVGEEKEDEEAQVSEREGEEEKTPAERKQDFCDSAQVKLDELRALVDAGTDDEKPDLDTDEFFIAISKFVGAMSEFDITSVNMSTEFDNLIVEYSNIFISACSNISFDAGITKYICNTVIETFKEGYNLGIPSFVGTKLASQLVPEGQDPSGGNDPDKGNTGAPGHGDILVGSGDMIYDPDTGEYVTLDKLIIKYGAIIDELRNSGALTEEQEEWIDKYYQYLYNGLGQDN